MLLDFLLQFVKQVAVEEFAERDVQPVTEFFQRDDAGILAFFVQHTVNGRRGDAGDRRQGVDGHVALFAQIQNALRNRFLGIQFASPPCDISQIKCNQICGKSCGIYRKLEGERV